MENIEIHKEDELYCLNDIAEKIINSKNVKEFVKKIEGKKLINRNYYITYDSMINLLNKSKSITAKEYLEFLKNKNSKNKVKEIIINEDEIILVNKYTTTKEEFEKKITNRNFVDFGTNNILYDDKKILFFEFEENIYFKGKDICDLLKYENFTDAIIKHIDKEDIFKFSHLEGSRDRDALNPTLNAIPFKSKIYSSKQITQLKKIKLNLEKKINKVIDNNTTFINESGLYSLIFSSKLPKAKEFKKWVTNDILISIRKTGSYNKNQHQIYYDENKIQELNNESCVYIIRVKDSLYKFGISKQLKIRISNHKRYLDYDEILEVFTLPNLNIALNIECKIKQYANNCKIRRNIENIGTELFETNDEYTIERIIKEIKIMVDNELDNNDRKENRHKFDTVLLLEDSKIKQLELEIKKYELLEIAKNTELQIKDKELQIEKIKQLQEIEKTKQLEIQEKNKTNQIETKSKKDTEIEKTKQIEIKPKKDTEIEPKTKQIVIKPKKDTEIKSKTIIEKTNKCIDCNILISITSQRCNKCEHKKRSDKVIIDTKRPSLDQLKKDLKTLGSYVQVGVKYEVSDNCIRKWIRKYEENTLKI